MGHRPRQTDRRTDEWIAELLNVPLLYRLGHNNVGDNLLVSYPSFSWTHGQQDEHLYDAKAARLRLVCRPTKVTVITTTFSCYV